MVVCARTEGRPRSRPPPPAPGGAHLPGVCQGARASAHRLRPLRRGQRRPGTRVCFALHKQLEAAEGRPLAPRAPPPVCRLAVRLGTRPLRHQGAEPPRGIFRRPLRFASPSCLRPAGPSQRAPSSEWPGARPQLPEPAGSSGCVCPPPPVPSEMTGQRGEYVWERGQRSAGCPQSLPGDCRVLTRWARLSPCPCDPTALPSASQPVPASSGRSASRPPDPLREARGLGRAGSSCGPAGPQPRCGAGPGAPSGALRSPSSTAGDPPPCCGTAPLGGSAPGWGQRQ